MAKVKNSAYSTNVRNSGYSGSLRKGRVVKVHRTLKSGPKFKTFSLSKPRRISKRKF